MVHGSFLNDKISDGKAAQRGHQPPAEQSEAGRLDAVLGGGLTDCQTVMLVL